MVESFDSVAIEVYLSPSWVDLTPDKRISPAPRWSRGSMGNGLLDRVGDPGYLVFMLDNSEKNSVSTLGYYSPGHANALAGWTTGLPVRLKFVYDGETFYKFYGRITPDGIRVFPGEKLDRVVQVTVGDFMAQASNHELRLLALLENKKIEQTVPYILANMPIQPLATEYGTGIYEFPTVFDTLKTATTATAEFQKLANSELGYIRIVGDRTGGETLRVQGLQDTWIPNLDIPKSKSESGFLLKEDGGYLLLETGGKIILNQVQEASFDGSDLGDRTELGYGKTLCNRVTVTTYPRRVDAAATTVLFTLQGEITIAAGATKSDYFCRYRDPSGGASYVNGRDMVTPVEGTDYTAGSTSGGTDKNAKLTVTADYGTEGVSYTLTNTDTATIYVTKLQARGKGIYIYDAVRVVYEDTASQAIHGIYSLNIDMRYQDDPTVGEYFANQALARGKRPADSVERLHLLANRNSKNMYGFLCLEPGTRLSFSEGVSGISGDFFVQGYEAELVGDTVWWYPVLQSSLLACGAWIWGQSTWEISTIWAPD